jgi:hypothetical protein
MQRKPKLAHGDMESAEQIMDQVAVRPQPKGMLQ